MFWPNHGMGPWGFVLTSLSTLLFWAVLIAGVVVLVRYVGRVTPTGDRNGAERILAERFARGEIDEQEYRQRLAVLRGETLT